MSRAGPPFPDEELAQAFACHGRGELEEAERLCRAVLRHDDRQAEAANLLGVIAAQTGRPDTAVDWLKRAVAIDGANAEFHYNLALAYQGSGDREAAISAYRQAIALAGDHAAAWMNLGNLLLHKGDAAGAEDCLRTACRLAPRVAAAHNSLASALMVRQQPAAALASFQTAVDLQSDYAEAHNGRGLALAGLGRLEEAAGDFERALALRPAYGEARSNLGRLRFRQDRLAEAEALFRQALADKPDYLAARLSLAAALAARQQPEAALADYDAVLARSPGLPEALAGKADALEALGRLEDAAAVLKPALARDALPLGLIPAFARQSFRAGRTDDAIARLEAQLAETADGADVRRALHFALGDLYDRASDFDRAFAHFVAGNASCGVVYDPQDGQRAVARRMAYFDAAGLAALPRLDEPSRLPVFIVGMPRSGTSLVEQILSRHPAVCVAGEREDMGRLARELGFRFGDADPPPGRVDEAGLRAASAAYLGALSALDSTASRVTDKMPYNFLHLGLISRLLPGARIIHCTRAPLDTCLSCFFQDFSRGNFQTFDLSHLGLYYRDYRRLMDHWQEVLDLPRLDLRYEDHVADPEATCRRLLAFLELPWHPDCLSFHESRRRVKTASRHQVREPIYRRSVARWRNYAAHLDPLRAALGDLAGAG